MDNKSRMDPKAKAMLVLFLLLVIGVIIGLVISMIGIRIIESQISNRINGISGNAKNWIFQQVRQNFARFSEIYALVTIIICMNLMLLLGLLYSYIKSFRETYSNFILGLILFLSVLFIQSFLSLPIIHHSIGQTISDLGIVNVLPSLFETIALIILFYLSNE